MGRRWLVMVGWIGAMGCGETPDEPCACSPDSQEQQCVSACDAALELRCSDEHCNGGMARAAPPAAIACVLDALRTRTPGSVQWGYTVSPTAYGMDEQTTHVEILDDGTARVSEYEHEQLCHGHHGRRRVELAPVPDIDACMREDHRDDPFACLERALGETIDTCEEPTFACEADDGEEY